MVLLRAVLLWKINNKQASNIVIEQGYSMKKPSEILVSLTINENDIKVHQITSNFIILKRENDILSPELGGFNRYHFVG